MTTWADEFAQSFDAIEIDRAPSPGAIDKALAACGADAPGFYLADDAGGRFVIDRDLGVISLRDEALLESLRGEIFPVCLRVIEASGLSYTLDLKLRVTGLVPQMVGAEDIAFGAGPASAAATLPAAAPVTPWIAFAPVRGLQAKQALNSDGAYGSLIAAALPVTDQRVSIAFGESLPAPAPAHAAWSL